MFLLLLLTAISKKREYIKRKARGGCGSGGGGPQGLGDISISDGQISDHD